MTITKNEQIFATYYVTGYGAEVQNLPIYQVGNAVLDNSGYSFGVIQTDLAQPNNSTYVNNLLENYNDWRIAEALE